MKRSSKKRNMAISKTKNAVFEDDFTSLLELLDIFSRKLPKDPPNSRFS
jgi:hypothetical protein